jgi:hypothetical protein
MTGFGRPLPIVLDRYGAVRTRSLLPRTENRFPVQQYRQMNLDNRVHTNMLIEGDFFGISHFRPCIP